MSVHRDFASLEALLMVDIRFETDRLGSIKCDDADGKGIGTKDIFFRRFGRRMDVKHR